jgi:arsenate reductase
MRDKTAKTSSADTISSIVTIYHNPRCSKSRQTVELLRERGIDPHIVEYLKTPPSLAELKRLVTLLGVSPKELVRRKEPEYEKAGLSEDANDAQLLRAMIEHPVLIERPIVVAGDKAALGRPPENVLKIL